MPGIDHGSPLTGGLIAGRILLPVGFSFAFTGSTVLSTAHVPVPQMGLAGGVMNTAMELGSTVGLAVFMSVAALKADVVEGYRWAFGTACGGYLVIAIMGVALLRRA